MQFPDEPPPSVGVEAWGLGAVKGASPARRCGERRRESACGLRRAPCARSYRSSGKACVRTRARTRHRQLVIADRESANQRAADLGRSCVLRLEQELPLQCENKHRFLHSASRQLELAETQRAGSISSRSRPGRRHLAKAKRLRLSTFSGPVPPPAGSRPRGAPSRSPLRSTAA